MKMNSKGQVLVMFIILLPIFLLMIVFSIDYGLLFVEKRKIDNNTYDAIEYYLKNIEDDEVYNKTYNLLSSNLDDVEININDADDIIEIEVISNYNSIINNIINKNIIIKYKGLKESKEIIKG